MKISKCLSLFFLLLLYSCSKGSPHYAAGRDAIFKHVRIMNENCKWEMEGFGGSFYDDDIKLLSTGFFAGPFEEISYEVARNMIVKGIEQFLTEINSDIKLRNFLNHYPFTVSDLDYRLIFRNNLNEELAYIYIVKSNLYFEILDRAQGEGTLIEEEPYSQALAKVQESKYSEVVKEEIHTQAHEHNEIK